MKFHFGDLVPREERALKRPAGPGHNSGEDPVILFSLDGLATYVNDPNRSARASTEETQK